MEGRQRTKVGRRDGLEGEGAGDPNYYHLEKGCFHRFSEKIGERVTSQVADEEIIVLPDLQQALDIGLPGDIVVICRFQTSTNTWKKCTTHLVSSDGEHRVEGLGGLTRGGQILGR